MNQQTKNKIMIGGIIAIIIIAIIILLTNILPEDQQTKQRIDDSLSEKLQQCQNEGYDCSIEYIYVDGHQTLVDGYVVRK